MLPKPSAPLQRAYITVRLPLGYQVLLELSGEEELTTFSQGYTRLRFNCLLPLRVTALEFS